MFIFERSILLGFAFLFGLTACGSGEDSSAEDEATAATIAAALDVGSGVCDVDTDGDIDRLDINQILDARNTPASGSGDPRDADGNDDHKINGDDGPIQGLKLHGRVREGRWGGDWTWGG